VRTGFDPRQAGQADREGFERPACEGGEAGRAAVWHFSELYTVKENVAELRKGMLEFIQGELNLDALQIVLEWPDFQKICN